VSGIDDLPPALRPVTQILVRSTMNAAGHFLEGSADRQQALFQEILSEATAAAARGNLGLAREVLGRFELAAQRAQVEVRAGGRAAFRSAAGAGLQVVSELIAGGLLALGAGPGQRGAAGS
jgi:hypothetical protein